MTFEERAGGVEILEQDPLRDNRSCFRGSSSLGHHPCPDVGPLAEIFQYVPFQRCSNFCAPIIRFISCRDSCPIISFHFILFYFFTPHSPSCFNILRY